MLCALQTRSFLGFEHPADLESAVRHSFSSTFVFFSQYTPGPNRVIGFEASSAASMHRCYVTIFNNIDVQLSHRYSEQCGQVGASKHALFVAHSSSSVHLPEASGRAPTPGMGKQQTRLTVTSMRVLVHLSIL